MIVNMDNVSTMLNSRVTVQWNEQEEYSGVLQEVDGDTAHVKYDDGTDQWEDINMGTVRTCAPSPAHAAAVESSPADDAPSSKPEQQPAVNPASSSYISDSEAEEVPSRAEIVRQTKPLTESSPDASATHEDTTSAHLGDHPQLEHSDQPTSQVQSSSSDLVAAPAVTENQQHEQEYSPEPQDVASPDELLADTSSSELDTSSESLLSNPLHSGMIVDMDNVSTMLNKRVTVQWEDDAGKIDYFHGEVDQINFAKNTAHVSYDDGDEAWEVVTEGVIRAEAISSSVSLETVSAETPLTKMAENAADTEQAPASRGNCKICTELVTTDDDRLECEDEKGAYMHQRCWDTHCTPEPAAKPPTDAPKRAVTAAKTKPVKSMPTKAVTKSVQVLKCSNQLNLRASAAAALPPPYAEYNTAALLLPPACCAAVRLVLRPILQAR